MANIDRLARAENELKHATKQLEELQARVKAIQQKVLKLRSDRILELVKNEGMGPEEVKEMIRVYQSGRPLRSYEADRADKESSEEAWELREEERPDEEN